MPRFRILAWVAAIAAAAGLAACTPEQLDKLLGGGQPATVQANGSVRGLVVDGESGQPVANALVAVGNQSARALSGDDGSYEVRGLPPGTHFVKGEADGYLTFFGEVQVADGPTAFDIRLRRPAGASPAPSPEPSPEPGPVSPSDAPATPASDSISVPASDSVAVPGSDGAAVPASDAASVPGSDGVAAPDSHETVATD